MKPRKIKKSEPERLFFLRTAQGEYPCIGKGLLATMTHNEGETPMYVHGKDNPEVKRLFWNAVLRRKFEVQDFTMLRE